MKSNDEKSKLKLNSDFEFNAYVTCRPFFFMSLVEELSSFILIEVAGVCVKSRFQ